MLTAFKIRTILHLAAIIIAVFAGMYLWLEYANVFLLIIIAGILALLLGSLYSLITATNKKLASFLLSIRYDDFEAHYSAAAGESSQYELSSALNMITDKFRSIRQEKEAQYQFLQAIVENVDTGLICFNERDETILMNKGIQHLLRKSYFPNLESVKKYNHALFEALREIDPGEKKLVKLAANNQILQLSVRKTILKIQDDTLHLYALQNIHTELERQELESWQKLIRILTHEILNSITPVVSLAEMAHERMQEQALPEPETMDDIKKSIEAIRRRSDGLLHFTETYRQMAKIPQPRFEQADPVQLLDRVLLLFSRQIQETGVQVEKHYPLNPLTALIDPGLMEQVLINLVKNALEAMAGQPNPKLTISATRDPSGPIELSVADNGPGIPESLLPQIFIPFFTTKKEGSGIGLSLSRQIVHLHKGHIFAASRPEGGSVFTVQL